MQWRRSGGLWQHAGNGTCLRFEALKELGSCPNSCLGQLFVALLRPLGQ